MRALTPVALLLVLALQMPAIQGQEETLPGLKEIPSLDHPVFLQALEIALPKAEAWYYHDLAITVRLTRPFESIPSQVSIWRTCRRDDTPRIRVIVYRADNSVMDDLYRRRFTAETMAEHISRSIQREEPEIGPGHQIHGLLEQLLKISTPLPVPECAITPDAKTTSLEIQSGVFAYRFLLVGEQDQPVGRWAHEVALLFNLFPREPEN